MYLDVGEKKACCAPCKTGGGCTSKREPLSGLSPPTFVWLLPVAAAVGVGVVWMYKSADR